AEWSPQDHIRLDMTIVPRDECGPHQAQRVEVNQVHHVRASQAQQVARITRVLQQQFHPVLWKTPHDLRKARLGHCPGLLTSAPGPSAAMATPATGRHSASPCGNPTPWHYKCPRMSADCGPRAGTSCSGSAP